MKKFVLVGVVAVCVIIAALIGTRMLTPPPAELDLARSKTSVNGTYLASIEPETEPVSVGPVHNWVLTLASADSTPAAGATIEVDGGMPDHGHGLPTEPQVSRELGDGRYLVEGVRFNMGGWWELTFQIESDVGSDSVTFNLML